MEHERSKTKRLCIRPANAALLTLNKPAMFGNSISRSGPLSQSLRQQITQAGLSQPASGVVRLLPGTTSYPDPTPAPFQGAGRLSEGSSQHQVRL